MARGFELATHRLKSDCKSAMQLTTQPATVKVLKIRTLKKFAVVTRKFEQDGFAEE